MRGRPGKAAIPTLVVAFALMVLSAGVAVACPLGPGGTNDAQGQSGQVDHAHGVGNSHGQDDGQGNGQGTGQLGGPGDHHDHDRGNDGSSGPGWGSGSGSGDGGGVSGSSSGGGTGTPPVTTPTVPTPTVPAPTVPAVAVVPALPVTPPVVALVSAPLSSQVDAASVSTSAAPVAADTTTGVAAAVPDLSGLAALAPSVPPVPAASAGLLPAARGVLSTPEARSLAAVLALAFAVLLFLVVQGRFDRGDPKLVGVRDGRDVARFR